MINKNRFKIDETQDSNGLTECSASRKLQILLLLGYISEAQYKGVKPMGTEAPYMGASLNIHQPGVPLRPILWMQWRF